MPYLIDGHNLIASIGDIHLDDPDDETQLIKIIQAFCARTRKSATLYFDRRGPGMRKKYSYGKLEVHFVTPPRTADLAIKAHLASLRGNAKNFTVVSSDRDIQRDAERSGARTLSSPTFAAMIRPLDEEKLPQEKPSTPMSEQEKNRWIKLFRDASQES